MFYWGILGFCICVQILAIKNRVVGKGKILTDPMRTFAMKRTLRSLEARPPNMRRASWWLLAAAEMREVQIMVLLLVFAQTLITTSITGTYTWSVAVVVYWIPLTVLYVDDLLTGIDRDKWKRRFRALKNKLKWRWVPAPVPLRVRA